MAEEKKKKGLWAMYKSIPHLTKMLTALILGAIVGFVFGEKATALQPLGTLFLNFLKMLTVPLVMCNLISGISSMDDPKMAGRVGGKILLYYMATTAFAVAVALPACCRTGAWCWRAPMRALWAPFPASSTPSSA